MLEARGDRGKWGIERHRLARRPREVFSIPRPTDLFGFTRPRSSPRLLGTSSEGPWDLAGKASGRRPSWRPTMQRESLDHTVRVNKGSSLPGAEKSCFGLDLSAAASITRDADARRPTITFTVVLIAKERGERNSRGAFGAPSSTTVAPPRRANFKLWREITKAYWGQRARALLARTFSNAR